MIGVDLGPMLWLGFYAHIRSYTFGWLPCDGDKVSLDKAGFTIDLV